MLEYFLGVLAYLPETWTFASVIVILLICGLGAPFPEEVPLFIAGYLVYRGDIGLPACIIWVFLAVLAGDTILFYIGFRWGNRLFEHPFFQKLLTPKRVAKVNHYFHRYGNSVIFLARFMAGVRGAVFLTAGILRMRFVRFLFFDGLAALVSVPTVVWVTYLFCRYFGGEIHEASHMVRKTERLLVAGVIVAVLLISLSLLYIQKRKKVP